MAPLRPNHPRILAKSHTIAVIPTAQPAAVGNPEGPQVSSASAMDGSAARAQSW